QKCPNSCYSQMIMSSFSKIEMSYFNNGKIFLFKLKGGYFARRGHYHHEGERVKEAACNLQAQ
ncbi:MAG: hypothetical protein AB1638_13335, partial [Nitrospirota bacterium]